MCTSRRDIDLFMSAIRGAEPHLDDPALFPQPWVKTSPPTKLRVGVMRHDGVVMPQPPMLRGFDMAVKKLSASDKIDVVEFQPFQQRTGYNILVRTGQVDMSNLQRSLYFEDGGANIHAALKAGEEDALPLTKWLLQPPLVAEHNIWESWKVSPHLTSLTARSVTLETPTSKRTMPTGGNPTLTSSFVLPSPVLPVPTTRRNTGDTRQCIIC